MEFIPVSITIFPFDFVTILVMIVIVVVIVIDPHPLCTPQNTGPPQKAFPRPIEMRCRMRRISQICAKYRSAIGGIAYHEHIPGARMMFAYFPAVVV
jgi:hypothetical protein